MINYIKGNLFEAIKSLNEQIVIPHISNDIGGWGSGFVLGVRKHFPEAELAYRLWHKSGKWQAGEESDVIPFELGQIQWVDIKGVSIVNMIAQHSTITKSPGTIPIRYIALAKCLEQVAKHARGASIHCPKFGAGLAGGDWNIIEALVKEAFVDLNVTVYELE